MPTKAWRESRARERKPKRVILKPEESEERGRETETGKGRMSRRGEGEYLAPRMQNRGLTQPDNTRGL